MAFGKGDYVVLVWEHDDKDAKGKPIKPDPCAAMRPGVRAEARRTIW
jgi:hypothetical protein